jgi:hypothetical protein
VTPNDIVTEAIDAVASGQDLSTEQAQRVLRRQWQVAYQIGAGLPSGDPS